MGRVGREREYLFDIFGVNIVGVRPSDVDGCYRLSQIAELKTGVGGCRFPSGAGKVATHWLAVGQFAKAERHRVAAIGCETAVVPPPSRRN